MKKITNLKNALVAWCPRPRLWDHRDSTGKPPCELGYIRADHDGYRWHNTCWDVHDNLRSPELTVEFDAVYDAFRRTFKDRAAMASWCGCHAGRTGDSTEYNAYYEGNKGFYWLRMITRRGDYNLYLHCFSKDAMPAT